MNYLHVSQNPGFVFIHRNVKHCCCSTSPNSDSKSRLLCQAPQPSNQTTDYVAYAASLGFQWFKSFVELFWFVAVLLFSSLEFLLISVQKEIAVVSDILALHLLWFDMLVFLGHMSPSNYQHFWDFFFKPYRRLKEIQLIHSQRCLDNRISLLSSKWGIAFWTTWSVIPWGKLGTWVYKPIFYFSSMHIHWPILHLQISHK